MRSFGGSIRTSAASAVALPTAQSRPSTRVVTCFAVALFWIAVASRKTTSCSIFG